MRPKSKNKFLVLMIILASLVISIYYFNLDGHIKEKIMKKGRSPCYKINDCVIYKGKKCFVLWVSDSVTPGKKEYLYEIKFEDGVVNDKLIFESKLNKCKKE